MSVLSLLFVVYFKVYKSITLRLPTLNSISYREAPFGGLWTPVLDFKECHMKGIAQTKKENKKYEGNAEEK